MVRSKKTKANSTTKALNLFQNKVFTAVFFVSIFALIGGIYYFLQTTAATARYTNVVYLTGTWKVGPSSTTQFQDATVTPTKSRIYRVCVAARVTKGGSTKGGSYNAIVLMSSGTKGGGGKSVLVTGKEKTYCSGSGSPTASFWPALQNVSVDTMEVSKVWVQSASY